MQGQLEQGRQDLEAGAERSVRPWLDRESLLRGILDHAEAAIFVCDGQGRLRSVNQAYERIMGQNAGELLGRTVRELFDKRNADRMLRLVKGVFQEARPTTYEASFKIQKQVRTLIVALFPLSEGGRGISSVGGIITEITERKRFESELRIAHRALLVLGEANRAVIYAADEVSLIQEVCKIIVQKGGYRLAWVGVTREDDPSRLEPVAHFGLPDEAQDILDRLGRYSFPGPEVSPRGARRAKPSVVRHIHENPAHEWTLPEASCLGYNSCIAVPLLFGDDLLGMLHIYAPEPDAFDTGEVQLLVKLADNLAHGLHSLGVEKKRKEAEEALRASEARHRSVVEDQTEVISRFRADGTFTYVNEVYCRVFGKTREELMQGAWHPVCFQEDVPRVEHELAKLSPDHPVVLIENRVIDSQGQVLWMQFVNRGFYDEQDRLVEIQSVGRDITRQKVLQAETLRSAKLASLGELAAGVAHEVNNPITGIINCAQLLVDEASEKMEQSPLAETILKEGRRVAQIVRSLLSLAREDDGPGQEHYPTEALFLALDLVRAQMEKSGVDIVLHVAEELPLIWVDNGRLQQVFLNVLHNAHHALQRRYPDYHPEKKVVISVEAVRRESREMVEYRFADAGAGLSGPELSRVFDPFYSTKSHGEGTGLGLPISRAIVEEYGGRMDLVLNSSGGATAVVLLPRAVARWS